MYREVEAPKIEKPKLTSPQMNFDTQRFNDNAERIRNALQSIMNANKIHGELQYPPPTMDLSNYVFDAIHTQGDKHPHDVTETEARKFIDDAYFAIIKYKGNSYNYYGKEGAAFVRRDLQTIRTAFKAYEYDNNIKLLLEAFENEFRKERNFLPINFKKN